MTRGYRVWDNENKSYNDPYSSAYYAMTQDGGLDFYVHGDIWKGADPGTYIVEWDTGLKDKYGKKIYEGDIVFFFTEHFDKATGGFDGEDEHNATVEWFDNGFAFMEKIPYDPNIECEIIGNIHENPELLK